MIFSLLMINVPIYAFTLESYIYDEEDDVMPLLYAGYMDDAYSVATYILLPEDMVTTGGYTSSNGQEYAIKKLSEQFSITFNGTDDTTEVPIYFGFRKYLAASDYIAKVGTGYLFRQEHLIEPGTYTFADNFSVGLVQGYYAITPDYKNPFESPAYVENGNLDEATYQSFPMTISGNTKLYTIYDKGNLEFFLENVDALCTYAKEHEMDEETFIWNNPIIKDGGVTSLSDYVTQRCQTRGDVSWDELEEYRMLASETINVDDIIEGLEAETSQIEPESETSQMEVEQKGQALSESDDAERGEQTEEGNHAIMVKGVIIVIALLGVAIFWVIRNKKTK